MKFITKNVRAISSAVLASASQWTHARHLHFSFFFYSILSVLRHWRSGHNDARAINSSSKSRRCVLLPFLLFALLAMPPLVQSATCIFEHFPINMYTSNNYVHISGTQSYFIARGAYLSLYLIITIKLSLRLHVFHSWPFVFGELFVPKLNSYFLR